MNREELNELISNAGGDEVGTIILEPEAYDQAVIGISTDCHLVYDYDALADIVCAETENESVDDAMDFIDYNIVRALPYMANKGVAPIICRKM